MLGGPLLAPLQQGLGLSLGLGLIALSGLLGLGLGVGHQRVNLLLDIGADLTGNFFNSVHS